ncbi:MAG: SEC-C domain-containing protein [Phycisphaerae bacterium]|nr:SEC-C domain-containing protein [Phycisphaerae bacterium]
MRNNTLVLSDMDQTAVLMDYSIYEYQENGKNAVSRYLAETQLEPDSEKYRVAKAMSESFYALVQVEEVLPEIGVEAHDFLRDKRFVLVDIGFSHTAVRGAVIATRILPFDDFAITSGAPLPMDAGMLSKMRPILLQLAKDKESGKNDAQGWTALATSIIRIYLRGESATKVKYGEADIQSVNAPLRRDTRVGRNDPCPCGSGKKHKRCCGTLAPLR